MPVMRYLVPFVYLFLIVRAFDVLDLCNEECTNRANPEDETSFETKCNGSCETEWCSKGCSYWLSAANSSCHNVCNATSSSPSQTLHCVVGCSIGIATYVHKLKERLGPLSAPFLVADSLSNTSAAIQWEDVSISNITYLVQWRYDALSSNWEYYKAHKPLTTNRAVIKGLHPYTKYKFRIAFILYPMFNVVLSQPSVTISTLAYGAPSTPPKLTSVTAIGPNSVSITWDPPQFPNGQILAYVIRLEEISTRHVAVKEWADFGNGLHLMINGLGANTEYRVNITTRNAQGEGPADVMNVKTLKPSAGKGRYNLPAFLLIAVQGHVLRNGMNLYDDSQLLYRPINNSISINGLAIHVRKSLIFVSDSLGSVHRVPFQGDSMKRAYTVIVDNLKNPSLLSVDWLNDKLYIVEEKQIKRCSLSGDFVEVVVSGISRPVTDLHVDPHNGYLYWVVEDDVNGTVYRLNLDQMTNMVVPQWEARLVTKEKQLQSIAIDHKNFRLLVPRLVPNTVLSMALDGSDVTDFRKNSQSPMFANVKSLSYYSDVFFWTTGSELFGEEYHSKEDKYFHSAFPVSNATAVKVWHPTVQPYPVPRNKVQNLQAVFSHEMAKISWSKPRLLGGLGSGAWQEWSYEVYIHDESETSVNISIYDSNITRTSYMAINLLPNRVYSVEVIPYSRDGKGPPSEKFVGKTIREGSDPGYPYMLWSTHEGVVKSDIMGDFVETMVPLSYLNGAHVIDIAWHGSQLFLNTNDSRIYKWHPYGVPEKLNNVTNSVSIAIDWLAPKIYWSSPIHQLITRSNLDGSFPEPLPIVTVARELAIDGPEGRLYWATQHSVECARLNGQHRYVYFETGLFSGKHVMGLTLDFDRGKLYWMVRSHEGALLYSAEKCNETTCNNNSIEIIGSLSKEDVRGPLWYYSDRLYWLHKLREALVSDLTGQNVASLRDLGHTGLRTMAVVDPSLQPLPQDWRDGSIVVPAKIRRDQINIIGPWDNFTIVWQPESRVAKTVTVFYELRINIGRHVTSHTTTEPSYSYHSKKPLPAYSNITLSLKAYTYWGSSKSNVFKLHSPVATPSEPTYPRVFVSTRAPSDPYNLSSMRDIEIEFRWSPPMNPNGPIKGYDVECWTFVGKTREDPCNISTEELSYRLHGIKANSTYYFQVRARTSAGEGPYCLITEASTLKEHPVPKLLLAKNDSIELADVDTHQEHMLNNKVSNPVAVAFLSQSNFVYWLEESGKLTSSRMDGSDTNLVRKLDGIGTGIAVDWIGRYLYWSEMDKLSDLNSLCMMNLDKPENPRKLVDRLLEIGAIEVEPFSSTLLWTALQENGKTYLMSSDADGRNIRNFFLQSIRYKPVRSRRAIGGRGCDCPTQPSVGQALAIDRSGKKPEVLWVDGQLGHIWASDIQGCLCRVVVNATELRDFGLPPTSITVDKGKIYWSNRSLGKVFSLPKGNPRYTLRARSGEPVSAAHRRNLVTSEPISHVRGIRAVGDHLQPYPDRSCLVPSPYDSTPLVEKRTPSTLTLLLGDADRPSHCHRVSMAPVTFNVFYGPVDSKGHSECEMNLKACMVETTNNSSVTLSNLIPFTNYSVQVSAINYYNRDNRAPGPPSVFQTREGAPSAPVNVTAIAISPTRIDVFWRPPRQPNGNPISYEARWRTANQSAQAKSPDSNSGGHTMRLTNLEPFTEYSIVIRAYSQGGDLHGDSIEVKAKTFVLPGNFTLCNSTSRSLTIQWTSPRNNDIARHRLEYLQQASPQILNFLPLTNTTPDTSYTFLLSNLTPKEPYEVRLQLNYVTSNVTYLWPPKDWRTSFTFWTLGDAPGTPGAPEVKRIKEGFYMVLWEEAARHGGEDLFYELQFKPLEEQSEYPGVEGDTVIEYVNATSVELESSSSPLLMRENKSKWKDVYNGSLMHWYIADLPSQARYEFRVRAVTEYGSSEYSKIGAAFFLPEPGAISEPVREQAEVIVVAVLSASAFVVLSLFAALYIVQRRREKDKKSLQASGQVLHPDVELATLRELPHHGNFVHQNNALYAVGDIPTDEELSSIPHISREQIGLTRFLGSGAFGEVFEGTALDLDGSGSPQIKVAIKTLRKGATDQEKSEFLKEAKLMSNFNHEHILKLLGICLNNNPNFIILELMEGRDLQSYLRHNRPTAVSPCSLTLDDLLGICVDVAKGCKYLEEMHFVHRDLAARNCLVSSTDPAMRLVKIGDFGLARDIYKNDYYRKEGEGLLPVRWMAPESLVDGVFTSQSDIWAFGVLLWEVMTLGQQPYPARTNLEVLHYVRGGGRLDKPSNCPDDLHELMVKCWSYSAELRPSFSYCLETLVDLKHKWSARNTPVVSHNYIRRYYDEELAKIRDNLGDNRPLLAQGPEDDNDVRDTPEQPRSYPSSASPLLRISMRNGVAPGEPAKYLELLADTECPTDAEGYELPMPLLPAVALERLKRVEHTHYTPMRPRNVSALPLTLPPTCLTTGQTTTPKSDDPVETTNPFYLNRNAAQRSAPSPQSSPIVTSALLKTPPPEDETPLSSPRCYRGPSPTCTPSRHRCSPDVAGSSWSLSSASTAACQDSKRNSGISTLSTVSGVELNYTPKSSWC